MLPQQVVDDIVNGAARFVKSDHPGVMKSELYKGLEDQVAKLAHSTGKDFHATYAEVFEDARVQKAIHSAELALDERLRQRRATGQE